MTKSDILDLLEAKQIAARSMCKHASKNCNKNTLKMYQRDFAIYSNLIEEVKML